MSDTQTPTRLTRSTTDRVVAGVCGGLAEYTGLDPVIFRVVVAVAALMGGAGLAAYLLAWLVIPAAEGESPAHSLLRERDWGRLVLIGLAVFAVSVVTSIRPGNWPDHGGGGFGLLVVLAVGVWFWTRHDHPSTPPTVVAPARPVPPARRGRGRSKLGLLTVSVMLVVAGLLALAQVSAGTFLAGCLIVVGAGLLAGAWWGHARALVVLGVLLAGATAVASVADVPLAGGIGDRRWIVHTGEELRAHYRLGVGNAELDLTDLKLTDDRRVEVTVGMGDLRVHLPPDADVDVRGHAGFGVVSLLGRESDGADVERHGHATGGQHHLVLAVRVGMGRAEVDR
jgi:phage shock protein PspC (stress-responsive transcriptional regulator)